MSGRSKPDDEQPRTRITKRRYRLPPVLFVGEAFRFRSQESVKPELVIFLRPWVIRSPDVRTDLAAFKRFLPQNIKPAEPALSEIGEQLNAPPAGVPEN